MIYQMISLSQKVTLREQVYFLIKEILSVGFNSRWQGAIITP
ncbi:hypothetical protein [Moorena sp. SIO1G6]|nr:hypothetical protein [Moorena sp. SIO1G6]